MEPLILPDSLVYLASSVVVWYELCIIPFREDYNFELKKGSIRFQSRVIDRLVASLEYLGRQIQFEDTLE